MRMKSKIIFLGLLFIFITMSGFGCKCVSPQVKQGMRPITLNYWRVWDGPDAFQPIITRYQELHPFINIKYRKLRYAEYEDELIEAFATDRGPDILSLHNTWLNKYQAKDLIAPMPPETQIVYPIVQGAVKKEVIPELRTEPSITLKEIERRFVDVVYNDVVIEKDGQPQVYGLPLSVDSLAMFYNKDLFNNAGITSPSAYWNTDFQQDVKKLTKQNNTGRIIQSGVALGGSDNIERSSDILSLLMMQIGAVMMEDGSVKFHQKPERMADITYTPGVDALRFYTDFANPAKEVYCWNKSLDSALDLFTQNRLGMMFGYAYMLPQIKTMAPKLEFSIAPMPQVENVSRSTNYANYWVEAVSNKILTDPDNLREGQKYAKQKFDAAWNFVQFLTEAKQARDYLEATNKPTALRELVDEQRDDQEIGVFADQVLTAKSWYRGMDVHAAEELMREMIDKANEGELELTQIVTDGARKVQQTVSE
jgi:multiple sugar transport system substrate-binding protein